MIGFIHRCTSCSTNPGGGYIKVCRYQFANAEISNYKWYEEYYYYDDDGLTTFYRIGAESTGIAAWNKLYKKELFEGYRFPDGKIYEDSYLVYKLMDNAKTVTFVDLPLYYYYQRDDGIMGESKKGFKESDLDRIKAREEQYRYVRNKHRKDLYIESARMLLKAYSWCYGRIYTDNRYKEYKILLRNKYVMIKFLNPKATIGSLSENYWLYESMFPNAFPLLFRVYRKVKMIIGRFKCGK